MSDPIDADCLPMLYPELVARAMDSQEPATETRESSRHHPIYSAAYYDPEKEAVWRADIEPGTDPLVHFARCYPTDEWDFMQRWQRVATDHSNLPQDLGEWESLFTVFNAALGLFNQEARQ